MGSDSRGTRPQRRQCVGRDDAGALVKLRLRPPQRVGGERILREQILVTAQRLARPARVDHSRRVGVNARETRILMKTNFLLPLLVLTAALAQAQDAAQPATPDKPKDSAAPAKPSAPMPTQDELEAAFKTTLTKAVMTGRWCMIKDGKLGPEQEEKYTIVGVNKLGGDVWMINARIQYGKKDLVAPIPVQVKWAGDTPVIIVDKVGVPGGGTYSARVLIYEKTYAGTWTGGDHGGLLNGVITAEKPEKE